MRKIIPKPKLLPIRISVQIESKNGFRIDNIHIKPYENVNDLFKQIEDYQSNRGDSILNWNKEKLQIQLSGPLRVDNEKLKFEMLNSAVEQQPNDENAMQIDY